MPFTKDRSFYLLRYIRGYSDQFKTYQLYGAPIKLLRTRTGVSNPHWKDQVSKQQNATTAMTGTYDTYECLNNMSDHSDVSQGYVDYYSHTSPTNFTILKDWMHGDLSCGAVDILPAFWAPTMSSGKAYNKALIEYLKKVRQVQTSFSAPTFIGELRESIHMIRHPAQGLRNLADAYLSKVKAAKKKSPKNWKKNLSGLWLEQAFGWQPLIADIQNAYKTYKGLATVNEQVPVTAYGQDMEIIQNKCLWSRIQHNNPPGMSFAFTQRAIESFVVRFKGMVVHRVDATVPSRLEPFGLDFAEFLPTAWELLPWSFLVDYFSNIGDIITANAANVATCAWQNVSVIQFQTYEIVGHYDLAETKLRHTIGLSGSPDRPFRAKYQRRYVTRTPNVGVYVPLDLTFEIPGKPAQWANMLALAVQVHGGINPQSWVRKYG